MILAQDPYLWKQTVLSNHIGQLTDELTNAKITKFVGVGGKNCGFENIEDRKVKSTWTVSKGSLRLIFTAAVMRLLSGRLSDSGARGQGVRNLPPLCLSLSKTLYSPKSTGNTQKAVTPSRHY